MDYYVGRSLRAVLIERIYPIDIALIRNDSRTAKLVFDYVASVLKQIEVGTDTEFMTLEFAKERWFQISPLAELSEGTIRKYISELWSNEAYAGIKPYVQFANDEFLHFDTRA